MALPTLTTNCLESMKNGMDVFNPVVQICQMKRVNPDDDIPRFKLFVTDGVTGQIALASSSAAESVVPYGPTDLYSIIRLKNYTFSTVSGKKLLVIVEFDLLMPGNKIGKSFMPEASSDNPTVHQNTNRPAMPTGQVSSTRPNGNLANGNVANANAHKSIQPIDSLTPYQNKWCIKARVTDKKPIKHYSNARGEGKVFSIDLADDTCSIRATGFNQECDRFYEMLREGQVFYIRGGQIKAANKQYSSLNNDYELTFSSETQIDVCYEESNDKIPAQMFNFTRFNCLQQKPKETLIDIIGVVDTVSQCETIVAKQSQKEFKKRTLKLIDDTQCSVSLTLWGDDAETFDSKISSDNMHPIIAVKGVRISDFQGISLSVTFGGKLVLNPELPESFRLRSWYDSNGCAISFQNLSAGGPAGGGSSGSQFTLLGVADAERLGTNEKADYFTVKATISALKRDNCLYKACPTADCNKKLVEQSVDSYRCEKCSKEFINYKWRLMLNAQLADFTGQVWVTFFDDMAQIILGHSSEEMGDLKLRDEEAFNIELNKALFKTFTMRLRAKMETYNDETRVKYSCYKVENMKYNEYIRYLQEELQKFEKLPTPAF